MNYLTEKQLKTWKAESGAVLRTYTETKTFRLPNGAMKTANLRRDVYDLPNGQTVEIKIHRNYCGVSDRTTFRYYFETVAA